MKRVLLSVVMAVGSAGGLLSEPAPAFPPGEQLLADMRAQMPREPLTLTGELQVRKRKGVVVRTLAVEIVLDLGAEPQVARYTLRDAFGKDLEQLTITRSRNRPAAVEYASGNPLVKQPEPDLFQPLAGTDMSWTDLSLAFLWWEGGKTVQADTYRGQSCYVVEVPAPAGKPCPYAKVRLWMDEKIHVVLQAEGYDAAGKLVRRLMIKSCKKMNDRWMIKDMELQSYPSEHRTDLRILTLKGISLDEKAGEPKAGAE